MYQAISLVGQAVLLLAGLSVAVMLVVFFPSPASGQWFDSYVISVRSVRRYCRRLIRTCLKALIVRDK
jgi:hypothetical protein